MSRARLDETERSIQQSAGDAVKMTSRRMLCTILRSGSGPLMTEDERFMDVVLARCEEALHRGDCPVASIIVRGGAIVGEGQNRATTGTDPTVPRGGRGDPRRDAPARVGRPLRHDALLRDGAVPDVLLGDQGSAHRTRRPRRPPRGDAAHRLRRVLDGEAARPDQLRPSTLRPASASPNARRCAAAGAAGSSRRINRHVTKGPCPLVLPEVSQKTTVLIADQLRQPGHERREEEARRAAGRTATR